MVIKILGSGCQNCVTLGENTATALRDLGKDVEIIKITNKSSIQAYGVKSTPALVIDEKVVSAGKVLNPEDIAKILAEK